MILDVPFYKNNNGKRCLQASMQSVLKFLTHTEYSLEKLDSLTNRRDPYGTWTTQAAAAFYELGLSVKYFSKTRLEPFLAGETFIRGRYGVDAQKILSETDLPVLIDSIKKVLNYKLVQYGIASFDEIISSIAINSLPILLVDYNKLIGKTGPYQGHFVVLIGYEAGDVIFHNSGPSGAAANMRVTKELLVKAWNANGTDNDVLIVKKE